MALRPLFLVLLLLGSGCAQTAAPTDQSSIIGHTLESTAQLTVKRADGKTRAGSAVVVAADPASGKVFLLTAAHLLEPVEPQQIEVVTQLRRDRLPVNLLAIDSEFDLALVEAVGPHVKPVAFAGEATLGDAVWVVAFPWGRRRTVVSGIVSQLVWDDPASLNGVPLAGPVGLIDASVSYGMSGGGVFDRRSGALLGVVRGFRSARMRLPGEAGALNLPVAGETTVVPTRAILCFLNGAGFGHLIAEAARGFATDPACGQDK